MRLPAERPLCARGMNGDEPAPKRPKNAEPVRFIARPPLPAEAVTGRRDDRAQLVARVRSFRDEAWLEPALQWRRKLLQSLMSHPRNRRSLFNSPATSQLGSAELVSRYVQAVERPMDLSTVKRKLDAGVYDEPFAQLRQACGRTAARNGRQVRAGSGGAGHQSCSMQQLNAEHAQLLEQLRHAIAAMLAEICLVFSNALAWNAPGSLVASAATAMRDSLEEAVEKHERADRAAQRRCAASSDMCEHFSDIDSDESADHETAGTGSSIHALRSKKRPSRSCALCLRQQLWFHPPQLQCQGPCSSAITGEFCYSTRDGTRQWCDPCFVKLFPEHSDAAASSPGSARRGRTGRHSSLVSLPSGNPLVSGGVCFDDPAASALTEEDAAKRVRAQRRLSQQTYEGNEMWGGRGRGHGRRRNRGGEANQGSRDCEDGLSDSAEAERGAGSAHASAAASMPADVPEQVAEGSIVGASIRRREAEAELAAQVAEMQRQAALQDLGCSTPQDASSVGNALRGICRERVPVPRRNASKDKGHAGSEDADCDLREQWVRCTVDGCRRHMHRVCAMHNPREQLQRASCGNHFVCPHCVLGFGSSSAAATPPEAPQPTELNMAAEASCHEAAALPRTQLGDYIERCVRKMLIERLTTAELDPGAAANPANVTVRVVSAARSSVSVGSAVRMHFVDHAAADEPTDANSSCGPERVFEYPESLPCVSKCVLVFQTDPTDGKDICLFSLYALEFGADCPLPNRGRVYIAYLDSVRYFQPARLRTALYHEVLVSYLSACAQRRFEAVHIWACPPSRSTDYVFWRHPANQRTPSRQRLRAWYAEALEIAKSRGILSDVQNLFDSHFAWVDGGAAEAPSSSSSTSHAAWATMTTRRATASATSAFGRDRCSWPRGLPPFFPGDCWPLEAEQAALSGGWIAEGTESAARRGYPSAQLAMSLVEQVDRFAQVSEHLSSRITRISACVPNECNVPTKARKLASFVCRGAPQSASAESAPCLRVETAPSIALDDADEQHQRAGLCHPHAACKVDISDAVAADADEASTFEAAAASAAASPPTPCKRTQQSAAGKHEGKHGTLGPRDNSLHLSPVAPAPLPASPRRPALNITEDPMQAHQAATTPRSIPLSPTSRARHQHVSTRPPTWLQREVALTVQASLIALAAFRQHHCSPACSLP